MGKRRKASPAVVPIRLDRRDRDRMRPRFPIPLGIGPRDGIVLDFSHAGARVRHAGGLRIGSRMRVAFPYQSTRFRAMARVLASRVVATGGFELGATMFESRLRFDDVDIQGE